MVNFTIRILEKREKVTAIKRFKKLKLTTKIVLSMTMLICLYSLVFVVVSVGNTEKELYNKIEEENQKSLEQFNNYLDTLQKDFVSISSLIYTNDRVMDIMNGKESIINTRNRSHMKNFLLGMLLFRDIFDFAGIMNEGQLSDGNYVANDTSFGINSYEEIMKSDIFKEFTKSGKNYATYILEKENTDIISQNRADKLLFVRTIRNPQKDFDLIGYSILGVNLRRITEFCNAVFDSEKCGVEVYDENGKLIYAYGQKVSELSRIKKETIHTGKYKEKKKGEYILATANSNQFNWDISSYMDTSRVIQANFWNTYAYAVLIALAAVSVFGIVAGLLTKALNQPLKQLLESMKILQQGDFNQYVPVHYNDEVGELTEGYNRMVKHIRDLINQNYMIKIQEKEAQLGALQAQINPHFLYNMLDLLYWKASTSGQNEMTQYIYSMSKLFRLSLNKGEMWLTIENEQEFLMHYLSLQKALMSEKLKFSIDVEEELLHTKIPRFLFQPFVENAVVHGFARAQEMPEVRVAFFREGKNLVVFLEDNGCGMEQEMANRIFTEETGEFDEEKGYAVSNVLKRLRLYFGDNYTIRVVSAISQGTKITLTLNGFLEKWGERDYV